MEFLAAAFAEAVFFGAEISDGAEFLTALFAPVEFATSPMGAPFAAWVFSAGGGTCADKSHIKGKKVRLIKNAERIAIWAIFVSI